MMQENQSKRVNLAYGLKGRLGADTKGADSNLLRLLAMTCTIFIVMCLATRGRFLSVPNFQAIGLLFPELAILSLAMMLAMFTGGIDLSVVAIANLSGLVAALIMTRLLPADTATVWVGWTLAGGVVAALVTGAICGAINGMLIARFHISAILATLGTMQLFTGLALVLTGGQAITGFPDPFLFAGNGEWWGLPIPFLLFAILAWVLWVIVSRTPFGLRAQLTGSNPLAALFSGIRVPWILFRVYLTTGILASLTGLLMIARTNSAKADYGSSYLLQAILVAVLGGVSPTGGIGSVGGVVTAVIALQMLASGFNMLHFSNFSRDFFWGLFLLLIMVINHYADRRGRGG
jgi:simple sugar transport system permease protein